MKKRKLTESQAWLWIANNWRYHWLGLCHPIRVIWYNSLISDAIRRKMQERIRRLTRSDEDYLFPKGHASPRIALALHLAKATAKKGKR